MIGSRASAPQNHYTACFSSQTARPYIQTSDSSTTRKKRSGSTTPTNRPLAKSTLSYAENLDQLQTNVNRLVSSPNYCTRSQPLDKEEEEEDNTKSINTNQYMSSKSNEVFAVQYTEEDENLAHEWRQQNLGDGLDLEYSAIDAQATHITRKLDYFCRQQKIDGREESTALSPEEEAFIDVLNGWLEKILCDSDFSKYYGTSGDTSFDELYEAWLLTQMNLGKRKAKIESSENQPTIRQVFLRIMELL